jgi:hypothetical protein
MSFKRFDKEDIAISADSIVAPAWSGQVTTLTSFNTSSDQVASTSGQYYYNIYQTASNATGAAVQFALAYGNRKGSGSALINSGEEGKSPSSIIYGQYRTLINGDENTDFTFGNATPDSIYVLSINRGRYKEKLLPGTFNLKLTSGSATINLTDNSETSTTVSYVDSGRVYDIVSGSNGLPYSGTGYSPVSGSYGKFLPDVGVIILNAAALGQPAVSGGILLNTSQSNNADGGNLGRFYNAVNAGGSFKLQSEETVTSNYVFVRVRNSEFNYSTNPSNISGSGELRYNIMVNSPQAYVTTIGLYNDNNDLLGVAKLSKPLLKDFTKEVLVRIKLDY